MLLRSQAYAVAFLALLLSFPPAATHAQSTQGVAAASQDQSLREKQTALFDQLFEKPDDLDLMFEYAAVSAQLEDYEAAISTLERMLTYNKNLPRVRLELGALYYNLGSYEVAKSYLQTVSENPATPAPVQTKVAAYLQQIERRTKRNKLSGEISAGVALTTNANSGPDNVGILLAGLPATLNPNAVEEGDVGGFVNFSLSHSYDLRRANDDSWRTDAGAYILRYNDVREGDLSAFYARTGPQLSLDDQQYGPKLRPFVDVDYVRYGRDPLYRTFGIGAEYGNTLSNEWYVFSEVRAAHRDYFSPQDNEDGALYRAVLGAAYAFSRHFILRGTVIGQLDMADFGFNRSREATARLSFGYQYDPGITGITRRWSVDGFADATYRDYGGADPIVAPTITRTDKELRIGLRHTFQLPENAFLRLDASAQWRDSNITNFDLTNYGFRASVGYAF